MKAVRVVIASNAFKNSCSALEACLAIAKGTQGLNRKIEYVICPLADGGDGTLEVLHLLDKKHLKLQKKKVIGPLSHHHMATYGINSYENYAIIEQSEASGIGKLREIKPNAWMAHTYAMGQLIQIVYQSGIRHILLTLGGSASIDVGLGLLQALGLNCISDEFKRKIYVPQDFKRIVDLNGDQLVKAYNDLKFTVLVDVNNRLFGKNGAVVKFGEQKGLQKSEMIRYESYLYHITKLLESKTAKKTTKLPGSGAGGGVLVGLASYFDVEVLQGASYVALKSELDEKIKGSDLVFTGEGTWDSQTLLGKGPGYVLARAKRYNKPVIGLFGQIKGNTEEFLETYTLSDSSISLEDRLNSTKDDLTRKTKSALVEYLQRFQK